MVILKTKFFVKFSVKNYFVKGIKAKDTHAEVQNTLRNPSPSY